MSFRISVDTGGTFTDFYVEDDDGGAWTYKTPTTPDDLTEGLFDGFEEIAESHDLTVEEFLGETGRLIHGTTAAINAIIEGEVSKTALICTAGFRDVLTLREGGKRDPYDWDVDNPEPYVPRELTFGVEERINAEGEVVTPLEEDECREVVERAVSKDVDAIAVSLLWAHRNPVHERRIRDAIAEVAPDLDCSISSSVCPIAREYRRTSATVINASLYGVVGDYLSSLREKLRDHGFDGTPLIVTCNGGVMGIEEVLTTPIWMVGAGPTMLPVAATNVVEREVGSDDVIALDMGGTSLDMGVIEDGNVSRSRDATVGDDHMLGIDKVDIESIGSGGGSIAWVDDGGLLHVGPRSAGAMPGPACYSNGGTEPTVTDAALVLGYLDEEYFLGGDMEIDPDAARDVLADVGDRLGLDVVEAAHAVYGTANQSMVNSIKEITMDRGVDPRNFVLSGGGGALGTHVVPVARELQVRSVILPAEAGTISSVGGLSSDITRDFSESYLTTGERFDHDAVNEVLESLRSRAEEFFERSNIPESVQSLSFFAECRYPEQVWELEISLPFNEVSVGDEQTLVERFHRVHDRTYGFRIDREDVEFINWRVEAVGETPRAQVTPPESGETAGIDEARHGTRRAFFEGEMRACPAYRSRSLAAGHEIAGPSFVDDDTTTIVLPPGSTFRVTGSGNYHIDP